MPRYRRPGESPYAGRYDAGYGPGGDLGHAGVRPRPDFGWQGDFRPHPGLGGGRPDHEADFVEDGSPWEGGTVYGPARYGLGPYHQRLRNRRRPDDELKKEVEEALFYDTWVDAEAIDVEVKDGVVTLRGELPDYDEVRYATDDAWDVDGVRGVHADLKVNPAKRPPLAFPGGRRGGAQGGEQGVHAPVVD